MQLAISCHSLFYSTQTDTTLWGRTGSRQFECQGLCSLSIWWLNSANKDELLLSFFPH
jgi:hypothetical protein